MWARSREHKHQTEATNARVYNKKNGPTQDTSTRHTHVKLSFYLYASELKRFESEICVSDVGSTRRPDSRTWYRPPLHAYDMAWRIEGINDEFDQFKLVQLVCIHRLTVVKNRIHSLYTHHCVSDISGIIIVVAICTAHCQWCVSITATTTSNGDYALVECSYWYDERFVVTYGKM